MGSHLEAALPVDVIGAETTTNGRSDATVGSRFLFKN